jgi:hypothetical protein
MVSERLEQRWRSIAANNAELEALMGWKAGSHMAELYTRNRDEALLAERVGDRMLADEAVRTKGVDSIPAPHQ